MGKTPKSKAPQPTVDLRDLRDFLQSQSAFDGDMCNLAAVAIGQFIDKKLPSLDHAFGLVAHQRRPRDAERRLNLAHQVELMRLDGKSWKDIATAFSVGGESITDERGIRRLAQEFEVELIVAAIGRKLDAREGGK